MTRQVSLYDAKTHLSALVETVSEGEEIIITKNGVPKARLTPIPTVAGGRQPANALALTFIADDFDSPLPPIEAKFNDG